jgi:L-lactate dehydrogenase complex protein LldG
MTPDHVSAFTDALQGVATVHETTAADFEDAFATAIEEPAIGTELPFEGVSLGDTPVDTEFSPSTLETATTGVTRATLGIADYGTVSIPTDSAGTELVSLYLPRHVAVLAASDIEPDIKATYEGINERIRADESGPRTQILATGPSATADMGTLVEGVHGPEDVHVILLEDR